MRRLVIAVAVLGFAVLVVVWSTVTYKSWNGERKFKVVGASTIRRAIEDYASEHGVYPAAHSMQDLKVRLVRKDGTPLPIRNQFGKPDELRMRDPWFRPWVVEVSDQNYSIRSLGADGKPDRDPPRGALLEKEPAERDTIIVDGLALQHMWNFGGGGDEGGRGSIVSLGRGSDTGKIIFDYRAVDVMRNGQVLASLPESPARIQGPAGQYQVRVRLSGSDYFENVIVERGKVLHHSIRIPGASITAKEEQNYGVRVWFSGMLFLNPRAEVWQGDRRIASDCADCDFFVIPGRYRFVIRDDTRIIFDQTRDLKDGDQWHAIGPHDPPPDQGLDFYVEPLRPRYAYPDWMIEGSGVHKQYKTTYEGGRFGFTVPPGKYELTALLSGQTKRIGTFRSLPWSQGPQNVAISWGNVHVSVAGPIEIHEASVSGWSAVVRQGDSVIARSERFPHAFFLLPGRYTVELLGDGQVRTSKNVAVAAGSEQWVELHE
jgi:type II secretory pathway pseudopilin PulG